MRCQSWKITQRPHSPLHRPGACDLCWEPCHNQVSKDNRYGKRCDTCWSDLAKAAMSDTTIALSLLNEQEIPPFVVERLSQSDTFVVAQAAQQKLTNIGA